MNTVQAIYVGVSFAVGIGLAAMLRRKTDAPGARALFAVALTVLIVALLCVGIVSRTFMRHVVQVIPIAVALALVASRSPLGPPAAAPIFTFWLGVMINIWLFVLGIARIFSGTFSAVEIALTIVIAVASALGILSIVRSRTRHGLVGRVLTAAAFAIGQLAAMLASFQFG